MKMISADLALFSRRLLFAAHVSMFASSEAAEFILSAGTDRYVSSAYLNRVFCSCSGFRSAALIMHMAGPNAEPWMTEELICVFVDVTPLCRVECARSARKLRIQL